MHHGGGVGGASAGIGAGTALTSPPKEEAEQKAKEDETSHSKPAALEVEPPSEEQHQQLHQQELQAMLQSRKELEAAIKRMVADQIQSHSYMIEDDGPGCTVKTALSESNMLLSARLAKLLPEKG